MYLQNIGLWLSTSNLMKAQRENVSDNWVLWSSQDVRDICVGVRVVMAPVCTAEHKKLDP